MGEKLGKILYMKRKSQHSFQSFVANGQKHAKLLGRICKGIVWHCGSIRFLAESYMPKIYAIVISVH